MTTRTKRPKPTILMTPPGTAVFPFLNNPDRGEYAKDKEFGQWKTGLRLPLADPATQAFIASLEKAYSNQVAEVAAEETKKHKAEREAAGKPLGATRPFKSEFADDGRPTGFVQVNFKRAGGGRDKDDPSRTWVNTVALFDTKNQPIDRSRTRIGGGSKIIVAYSIGTFATDIGAGISLALHAVQVLERADAPTKDAAQYGFQQKDDGYVDDTGDTQNNTDAGAASADGAGASDDNDV